MSSGSGIPFDGNDGLPCPEVRRWAETKYRLIGLYDELFATGMKNKWDQRVYIDLYAGAGYCRIAGTNTYLKGSPLIALTVNCPFDKYIFCEEKGELLDALKARAKRVAHGSEVACVVGDCDTEIDHEQSAEPVYGGPVRLRDQIRDFAAPLEILHGFSRAAGGRYGRRPQLRSLRGRKFNEDR